MWTEDRQPAHSICALNFTEENRTILKKATKEIWRELANK